jgi:hypothetical protein
MPMGRYVTQQIQRSVALPANAVATNIIKWSCRNISSLAYFHIAISPHSLRAFASLWQKKAPHYCSAFPILDDKI